LAAIVAVRRVSSEAATLLAPHQHAQTFGQSRVTP
jgi:hypothetical protein